MLIDRSNCSCVVRMPLSEPNVERYLDEHPGFLQKYVVTHLTETDLKDLYDNWYKVRFFKLFLFKTYHIQRT